MMEEYYKLLNRYKASKTITNLINLVRYIYRDIRKETRTNPLALVLDYIPKRKKLTINANEYYLFKLYLKTHDPAFINEFLGVANKDKYLKLLNPRSEMQMARNKFFTKILFNQIKIPTSRLLFNFDPEAGQSSDQILTNTEEASQYLIQNHNGGFVAKASNGGYGIQVHIFNSCYLKDKELILEHINGQEMLLSTLLYKEWPNQKIIFEDRLKQTEFFSKLHPHSINTIRIITLLHPDKTVELIACLIRVGRNKKWVDNAGKGGNIMLDIDPSTGLILKTIQFTNHRKAKTITHHPDTGQKITGLRVPNWNTITKTIIQYQQRISFLKAIGWDIAITPEGIKIIEINDNWDIGFQLISNKGKLTTIKKCYQSWIEYYKSNNHEDKPDQNT